MENNNSLIPIKENIFKKIKDFFRKVFFKNDNLINSINTATNVEDDTYDLYKQFTKIGYVFKEQEFINDINPEEDKKRFFQLYDNVKAGKVNIKNLNGIDLNRINQMIKKEVNIKSNKLS